MDMTPERWRYTERYLEEVFGAEDEHLRRITREARAAGLPDIAVSASAGAPSPRTYPNRTGRRSGERNANPMMRELAAGSRRRFGSRSKSAESAMRASMRARCEPRQ